MQLCFIFASLNSCAFKAPYFPENSQWTKYFSSPNPKRVVGEEQTIKMREALLQVTDYKSQPVEYCILMHCSVHGAARSPRHSSGMKSLWGESEGGRAEAIKRCQAFGMLFAK